MRLSEHPTSGVECTEGDRTVWWHWAPRFAKYVHKNIWNLTPTPCINLRHLHGYAVYWMTLPDNTQLSRQCMFANSIQHSVSSEASVCWVTSEKSLFWHAFAKLRQATISFVMSVHLSVRPNERTRLPLEGFSWNLVYKYFFENLSIKILFY